MCPPVTSQGEHFGLSEMGVELLEGSANLKRDTSQASDPLVMRHHGSARQTHIRHFVACTSPTCD